MLKVQSRQSFSSLRSVAFVVVAGCAVAAASVIWFRSNQNASVVALPTGLVVPLAVDPQQIMREKRNLPVQPVTDFSLIFPEN